MCNQSEPLIGEIEWYLNLGGDYLKGYHRHGPNTGSPVGLFIHGFKSHCDGIKSRELSINAQRHGYEWLRFDQRGLGRSTGTFQEFTLSRALEDIDHVLNEIKASDIILVGSSLGGLLALHTAAQQPQRIKGLVLIAPALRFAERLFDEVYSSKLIKGWESRGYCWFPDLYEGGCFRMNYSFYKDSIMWQATPTRLHCPVCVIHGTEDELLPLKDSENWLEQLDCVHKALEIVHGGDHQLNQWTELICHQTNLLWQEAFS